MLKNALQGCLLVVVFGCLGLLIIAVPTTAPEPTPTPTVMSDSSAAVVREVGVIVQPIVDASANAVRADTSAAHPPSTADEWGPTLTALCVVGMVTSAVVIVAIVWIVTRAGLLTRLVHALERWGEK